MKKRVVIVGGGIAGIMAARTLRECGITDVAILEKSRSVGGRLATRRIGEGKADHGAQFFTVRTKELQRETEEWLRQGWIQLWYADPYPRYRGTEGMNGLVKQLAQGLDIHLHTKVEAIEQTESGFRVQADNGQEWQAEAVLLTAPAPQATELLGRTGIEVQELDGLAFNPCFVLLATMKQPTSFPENGHITENVPQGVERLVDQQKKGVSKLPVVSVYMKGDWSKEHYALDEETAAEKILQLVGPLLGEAVEAAQLKRWRYAEATGIVRKPFVSAAAEYPLLIAGDAFLHEDDPSGRTRFESAFLSGMAAGEELANRL
ncbi:NAD(P)/FAD-dependent oxidoreductase [Ectobacillus ponti]|uniref:FAD-dependent oxidoreductase n=1 Tax=Ectobacillus ponti TaxID=2961894 RepID=A0AA42BQ33_9BACI|nr:FAD-dependent oxidoreductase [Ectobacillus ponti]MCP8969880.1 FAD-dependent oxidoreductase [Ectobacillus ponti]